MNKRLIIGITVPRNNQINYKHSATSALGDDQLDHREYTSVYFRLILKKKHFYECKIKKTTTVWQRKSRK